MISRGIALVAAALVVLSGCAADPAPASSPTATATATPTIAPTATPTPTPVALDPAAFATQIDFFGDGIDFDSADGNVHCGIWGQRPLG